MQTANKRYLIILVNVAVMLGIIGFVLLYAQRQANESIATEVAQFETATVTVEQVTANYLESEQDICNVWARYINSEAMTIDEAVSFIRASHVSPDVAAHIVFTDDGSLEGLSTRPRPGTEDFYAVSYEAIGLPIQLDKLIEQDGTINVSRSYTNPMSGIQSLAFCSRITLVDSNDRSKQREAVLLRVIPTEKLQEKWVFPNDRYKEAQVSLIDVDSNYIIKGRDYKNSNFIEFYKSYNQIDAAGVEELRTRLTTQSGSFFMNNSRGEECLIAYAPIAGNRGWTILNYIPASSLYRNTVDWFLIGGVACALLFLLIFDMALMNWFNTRLNEAAKEAEAANRAKSDFLSAMSHDIRTPMNAILGLTTIAQLNADDSAVVKASLHKIELASNHLLTLINDILDISKVESGKLSLTPAAFSISEVAENLVNIAQPMVEDKSIDFSFHTNDMEHEYLYADKLRINQVFINILSNALKYTEPHGSVNVDLQELASDTPGMVRLIYCVADTGMGMSEEFMERMYESFSRQTDSRVNSVQGTGLGLAITKQMVDLMEGTIECQSKLGEGTTFTVTLDVPIAEHEDEIMTTECVDAPELDDGQSDIAGMRVLVAEDNDINWEIISMLLDMHGIESARAENGQIAVDMLASSQPGDYDLVFMDVQMPVMNGIDATKAVRRLPDERVSAIPIIATTADAFSEDVVKCMDAGMNGHIAKPIDIEIVLKEIRRVKEGKL